MTKPNLHPSLDNGIAVTSPDFSGGTLVCACAENAVRVRVDGQIAHSQACGCAKCWKPDGAAFSIVTVAPHDKVTVVENGDKLAFVDPNALIQRHACKDCGVHMYGPVTCKHPFQGWISFTPSGSRNRAGRSPALRPSVPPPSREEPGSPRWTGSAPG